MVAPGKSISSSGAKAGVIPRVARVEHDAQQQVERPRDDEHQLGNHRAGEKLLLLFAEAK